MNVVFSAEIDGVFYESEKLFYEIISQLKSGWMFLERIKEIF